MLPELQKASQFRNQALQFAALPHVRPRVLTGTVSRFCHAKAGHHVAGWTCVCTFHSGHKAWTSAVQPNGALSAGLYSSEAWACVHCMTSSTQNNSHRSVAVWLQPAGAFMSLLECIAPQNRGYFKQPRLVLAHTYLRTSWQDSITLSVLKPERCWLQIQGILSNRHQGVCVCACLHHELVQCSHDQP